MEIKFCRHILTGISLNHSGIKYCNEIWQGPEYIMIEDGNAFEKNEERRIKIIEEMKQGIYHPNCQNCPHLNSNIELEKNIKEISKLTIFNWDHCNAACFYCSVNAKYYPSKKKSDYYNVLPIIKKLIKENRITKNSFCAIQGGEPTMLEEFPEIIDILLKTNCTIEVLSNGIIYEKCIVDMINKNQNNALCISVDCCSTDKYKKIKQVDKYVEVAENITRYIKETGRNAKSIRIKYFILPTLTNTKKEIDKFLKFCKQANVISVACCINYSDKIKPTTNQIQNKAIILSYKYFVKKSKKLGFNFIAEEWIEILIKNQIKECKNISFINKIKAFLYFLFA